MELTEFLLARIAEDEALDSGMPHRNSCRQFGGWPGEPETEVPCSCGVTDRILAECEAKRRIVEACDPSGSQGPAHAVLSDIALCAMASVYAGHPDYDEAWRP